MVSDDLFYHRFRDWVIEAPGVEDEKQPVNEEADGGGGDDNAEGGMNLGQK